MISSSRVLRPINLISKEGINLYEGTILSKKGNALNRLNYHLSRIDLSKIAVFPLVNHNAHNYKWGDATVRGYVDLRQCPWGKEYFDEVSKIMRQASLDDYANNFHKKYPHKKVIMATEGNGNLFWNLGHFAYVDKEFYGHYREIVKGLQTALMMDNSGYPSISAVDINSPSHISEINFLSGVRLMASSKKIGIDDKDPDTGRILASEFAGDFSVISQMPQLGSVRLKIFRSNIKVHEEKVDLKGMSEFSKEVMSQDLMNKFSKVLAPEYPANIIASGKSGVFNTNEPREEIIKTMAEAGYQRNDYEYNVSTGELKTQFKRSCFGHSLIGINTSLDELLIFKVYTDATRKGLTIEDTLDAFIKASEFYDVGLRDVLLMSSGGDLRFAFDNGRSSLDYLENSITQEKLLFKGTSDFGVTSALIFAKK